MIINCGINDHNSVSCTGFFPLYTKKLLSWYPEFEQKGHVKLMIQESTKSWSTGKDFSISIYLFKLTVSDTNTFNNIFL